MSRVLVDTSIWIDYFRGKPTAAPLDDLIQSNRIATNELILAELLPSIQVRNESGLEELLLSVTRLELSIDWYGIRTMQAQNLRSGYNPVGIPDLIIVQNALQNDAFLFENDKHFSSMRKLFNVKLMERP